MENPHVHPQTEMEEQVNIIASSFCELLQELNILTPKQRQSIFDTLRKPSDEKTSKLLIKAHLKACFAAFEGQLLEMILEEKLKPFLNKIETIEKEKINLQKIIYEYLTVKPNEPESPRSDI